MWNKRILLLQITKFYANFKGIGEVIVNLNDNEEKIITDVMYVPDIAANLLSVSKLTEKGWIVVFDNEKCRIYNKDECKIQGKYKVSATKIDGIYRLDQQDKHEMSVAMAAMTSSNVWHRRLGHLSYKGMQKLKNSLVTGIDFQQEKDVKACVPCIQGKQVRKTFPKGEARRAKEKLELIHSDLCGPMSEDTWSGFRYLLTFTDDYIRKTFGYLLKTKRQVFDKFVEFKILVENQTGLKIKKIRTDNGLEYCNKYFEIFFKKNGIIHETTVQYTPEQNGVAERLNRTIIERTRAMLQDSGLSRKYWGETVKTAIYVKNRSPTAAVLDATPEELWSRYKVDVSNLRVFGCRAFVHTPKELRKKLDVKSREYIMVGYYDHSKEYRLADPLQPGKVIKARDVIFLEDDVKKKKQFHRQKNRIS